MLAERKMFMRYISHEIRTPLNTTYLGMNVMKKQLNKNKIDKNRCLKTLQETQISCDIAISILNDMLLYDKVESGLLKLEIESISPWLFFKQSIELFYIQVSPPVVAIYMSSIFNNMTYII